MTGMPSAKWSVPDQFLYYWTRDVSLPPFVDAVMQHEEQILNCNMPDTEDGVIYENQDEDAVAMIEESPSGGLLNLNQPGMYFHFAMWIVLSFWPWAPFHSTRIWIIKTRYGLKKVFDCTFALGS